MHVTFTLNNEKIHWLGNCNIEQPEISGVFKAGSCKGKKGNNKGFCKETWERQKTQQSGIERFLPFHHFLVAINRKIYKQ